MNWEKIKNLVEDKYISIDKHPDSDLFIYNYTQKTQFESFWCEETENCRGLIVDKEKNIVARGFKKFWNLGEKLNIKDLPVYQPDITEKLDGSLGILYPSPGGGFAIATRGSFRSEQAQWATTWLKAKGDKRDWKENVTYLFEIIYPMNRIVVDYGSRAELVMIGMVHNWTGKISPYKEVKAEAIRLGFSYPKLYEKSLSEIEEYAKTQKTNEEGFVLFYPEDNLQIKIKLNDYVRLHRLTFGISVKSIWENMMEGKNVEEVFKDAPDEVYDWVKNWKTYFRKLEQQYMDESLKHLEIVNKMETRKEQAMYLQKEAPEYMGIVFGMLDGKEYLSTIYKKFRPTAEDAVKTVRVVKTSAL